MQEYRRDGEFQLAVMKVVTNEKRITYGCEAAAL